MAKGSIIASGGFTFTETSVPGVIVVDAEARGDGCGTLVETYRRPDFAAGLLHRVFRCEYELDAPMRAFLQTDEAAEIISRRTHQLLGL